MKRFLIFSCTLAVLNILAITCSAQIEEMEALEKEKVGPLFCWDTVVWDCNDILLRIPCQLQAERNADDELVIKGCTYGSVARGGGALLERFLQAWPAAKGKDSVEFREFYHCGNIIMCTPKVDDDGRPFCDITGLTPVSIPRFAPAGDPCPPDAGGGLGGGLDAEEVEDLEVEDHIIK